MISDDTDRTQAIIIKNFSHRWLKEADEALGAMKTKSVGTFDLFASLNAWGYPVVSRLTAQLRNPKSKKRHTND